MSDEKITVYQKPTCSKCVAARSMLEKQGVDFETVNYYEQPLTPDGFRELLRKLNASPRDLLRSNEAIAKELKLNERDVPDDELIEIMVKNPDLIQRPIVVRGDRAVLARPTENLAELL